MIRSYKELRQLTTFEERYEYLKIGGEVGRDTFGFDRYLNQQFYRSTQWRQIRNEAIVRDNGCDLGIDGYEIHGELYVHHMNPLTAQAIIEGDPDILNVDFLITTTHRTHNAIHYGDASLISPRLVERRPGDTKLW